MSASYLYALVLLAAIAHAVWNSLVKNVGDRLLMLAVIGLVEVIFGLALLPFVAWPGPDAWLWIGITTLVQYAAFALLLASYRVGDLSLVYPIARGAVIGAVALKEGFGVRRITAALLVTCGIAALALAGQQ